MANCEVCGKETNPSYICNYCGKSFCVHHKLPGSHNCLNRIFSRAPTNMREFHWQNVRIQPPTNSVNSVSRSFGQLSLNSEFRQIVFAWLVLGFCFSVRYLYDSILAFPLMFAVSLSTLGLGFIGHELSHRYVARRFGCWAEFRLWPMGLLIALLFSLISRGRMIFASPGAVYIVPRILGFDRQVGKREMGLISLSGPMSSIIVALGFYGLAYFGGFLGAVAMRGFAVNLWLAAFNLIPFGMMDGRKVFAWSPFVWGLVAIPTWIMTLTL